jgi:hypothetical protein
MLLDWIGRYYFQFCEFFGQGIHLRIQCPVGRLCFFVCGLDAGTCFAFFFDFGFKVFKTFLGSGQLNAGDGFPDEILRRNPAFRPTSSPNLGEAGLLVDCENGQLGPAWDSTVYDAMLTRQRCNSRLRPRLVAVWPVPGRRTLTRREK